MTAFPTTLGPKTHETKSYPKKKRFFSYQKKKTLCCLYPQKPIIRLFVTSPLNREFNPPLIHIHSLTSALTSLLRPHHHHLFASLSRRSGTKFCERSQLVIAAQDSTCRGFVGGVRLRRFAALSGNPGGAPGVREEKSAFFGWFFFQGFGWCWSFSKILPNNPLYKSSFLFVFWPYLTMVFKAHTLRLFFHRCKNLCPTWSQQVSRSFTGSQTCKQLALRLSRCFLEAF